MNQEESYPRRDALKALVTGLAATRLSLGGETASQRRAAVPEAGASVGNGRNQLFDSGWRFHRGDAAGAERPDFNDGGWRLLDLPHDWSIEDLPPRPAQESGEGALWGESALPTRVGPFDSELSEGGRDTGWFVGGTGWYRKRFRMASAPAGGQVEIVFDGVYMNSDVWLNGQHLGDRPYGYTAFAYDLTPHLRRDGENVLAVRARNEGWNSRWYSGSGIYRHVWLNVTGDVRVPLWGVCIATPDVSKEAAAVRVAVTVENRAKTAQDVTVRVRLLDAKNASVASREAVQPVAAGGEAQVEQELTVQAPQLWSPAAPRLYRVEVDLAAGGKPADHVTVVFGVRKIEVDAERGLRINGEAIKLKGGCVHHDNGLLGAAAIDRAEERRVELMKANGFNAIRTSHNPPSPAFLDACDRLGLVVMDEAFDQWEREKTAQDYHRYFGEWWRRDLEAMVLRDRNHPSVIMWSIGNEIPECVEPRGVEIAKALVDYVKRLDPTRPVTAAIAGTRSDADDAAFQHLDIAGYNYRWRSYEADHKRLPKRIIVTTESVALDAFDNWRLVEKHPYVIGDFVWTSMDYLGEAALGNAQLTRLLRPGLTPEAPERPGGGYHRLGFSWFNAYCGDIDLIGGKKPQLYYKHVVWGLSELEMAVQRPLPEGRLEILSPWGWSDELRSWTWPGYEGRTVNVRVYSSGEQVRLLLNGKEIGVKPVSAATQLKAEFQVPYEPGELKAVALSGGKPIAELAFKTAGPPAAIRLKADRPSIRRDRNDLAFVTLEVLDKAGALVPDASIPVAFSVSGAAELAAVGTANPKDVWSFRRPRPRTFHGVCLAIVRPTGVAGAITLRAQSEGLPAANITLQAT